MTDYSVLSNSSYIKHDNQSSLIGEPILIAYPNFIIEYYIDDF